MWEKVNVHLKIISTGCMKTKNYERKHARQAGQIKTRQLSLPTHVSSGLTSLLME
jgi:hypothetical protein